MSGIRKSHNKIKLDPDESPNSILKSPLSPPGAIVSHNNNFSTPTGATSSLQLGFKMESPTSNSTTSAATAFKPLINPFSIDALIGSHNSSSRSSSNSSAAANLSLGQHLSRAASLTAAFNSSQHSPYHLSNLAAAAAAAAAASSTSPASPYHPHHASSVLHPTVASHPSHHQLSYLQAAFTIAASAAAAASTAPNSIPGLPSSVTSTSNQG